MSRTLTIKSKTKKEEQNLTILYARLSKDDGKSGDSNSIMNQKLLLENFARDQKMGPTLFLSDDGISGTTFKRPAFQEAIDLVEQGRVKNFIVKDLSRFGRDYLKVGAFTEVAFPEKGVRFIAINDNVDSDREDDNSLAPFKNLFNEWYARDCSKKIKTVKRVKGNAGIPMGANIPYGYLKGKNYLQTHEWVVDETAAVIVRCLFREYALGKSMKLIAEELRAEKVPLPSVHKAQMGLKTSKLPMDPYLWTSSIVRQVLGYREYCGHTVNFKTYKKSYKTKQSLPSPPDQHKIFRNTHEAIIDEELFERV